MTTDRPHLQAALVIKWPHAAAAPAAREAARRLLANRVPATWSLDQASQVEQLASWGAARGGSDAALIVAALPKTADDEQAAARDVARRLELLRGAGMTVDCVQADATIAGGNWPRTLRALGVSGIVVEGSAEPAAARALPFGVWQFAPRVVVPHLRRWIDLFVRRRPLLPTGRTMLAVIAVDLARVGAAGSRSWREMEASLDQAAAARSEGAARLVTMGELTGQLTSAAAPRPQRSILRAA